MDARLLWGVAVRHSTVGIAGAAAPLPAGWRGRRGSSGVSQVLYRVVAKYGPEEG